MLKVYNDKGEELEYFEFPGGEYSFNTPSGEYSKAVMINTPVENSIGKDIVKLSLWADYCNSNGIKSKLVMGYIPAARADRGTPFGAKAYIDLINSCNISEIIVLDPHSPVSVSLLNNCKIANMAELMSLTMDLTVYSGIIAPDEGSIERATRIGNMLNLPVYYGVKKRDFETGRILDYSIELPELSVNAKLLVVDDICDGGGTFNYLAEISKLPKENLHLWVSHGIFSGEAMKLKESYEKIITSNTVKPYHNVADLTVDANSYMLKCL